MLGERVGSLLHCSPSGAAVWELGAPLFGAAREFNALPPFPNSFPTDGQTEEDLLFWRVLSRTSLVCHCRLPTTIWYSYYVPYLLPADDAVIHPKHRCPTPRRDIYNSSNPRCMIYVVIKINSRLPFRHRRLDCLINITVTV